jgi:solute carrier family 35 (UDP-sugar transporter), member A1/2/3
MVALTAYQNLDPLTYNTLNQTKTLSAALWCYLIMGRKQSSVQLFALFLLLLSALVLKGVVAVDKSGIHITAMPSLAENNVDSGFVVGGYHLSRHFTHGIAPILLTSFISGLAGAISQKNLQAVGGGRNALLFSMELSAATCLILLMSLVISSDGEQIVQNGFWEGWSPNTLIPIFTNSAGGLVVGLVTKHAGVVRKGFALTFGILLSGIVQSVLQPDMPITYEHILGGAIAALSLYLHAAFPPIKSIKQD